MSTRESFVARFGEEQARAVEAAAAEHGEGTHTREPKGKGSDPFRWAIVIAIGYECMSKDRFRDYHGITAPWDEISEWIKAEGDIAAHDGDCDFLALLAGAYNEYVGQPAFGESED